MVGTIISQKRAGEHAQNAARPQGEMRAATRYPRTIGWHGGSPSCGGLELRIIFAASAKCGLLNQSHTRSTSC